MHIRLIDLTHMMEALTVKLQNHDERMQAVTPFIERMAGLLEPLTRILEELT